MVVLAILDSVDIVVVVSASGFDSVSTAAAVVVDDTSSFH